MTQAAIRAVFATSVGFLIRHNGLVSFGHAFYFGLGAYLVAILSARHLVSIEVIVIAAIIGPMILAFLIGLMILRVPGVAFSMLTLAVAQAFYELVLKWRGLANGAGNHRLIANETRSLLVLTRRTISRCRSFMRAH